MLGEVGQERGEGEEVGRAIMFRSERGRCVFHSDAACELWKSDSQRRWKETTKAHGTDDGSQEMSFQQQTEMWTRRANDDRLDGKRDALLAK